MPANSVFYRGQVKQSRNRFRWEGLSNHVIDLTFVGGKRIEQGVADNQAVQGKSKKTQEELEIQDEAHESPELEKWPNHHVTAVLSHWLGATWVKRV